MQIRQLADEPTALGQAVNLLRRHRPFARYPFGRFANVLGGQIRRRHYLFTFDGRTPVGYVGWALCREEVARAWIEHRSVPSFDDCCCGDCWVGITFYAGSRAVCFAQVRHLKELYRGYKAFGIRDYGGRQRAVAMAGPRPHAVAQAEG